MFPARRNSVSDTESTSFRMLSFNSSSVWALLPQLHLWHAPHFDKFHTWRKKRPILLIFCQQRHSIDIMHHITVPLHKIHLSVLYNFWATVIFYGFSCSSCIAFRTDVANGLVYCASPISYFLGDVSNLVIISYRSTCLLRPPFLSRMEFCSTFSRIR